MTDTLLYATPTGKHPRVQWAQSMRALELGMHSFGVRGASDFVLTSGPVQMARCKIVEQVLKGTCQVAHDCRATGGKECKFRPYDYVLMHDDDLSVWPWLEGGVNPLDEWHKMMQEHPEIGVIGAVYLRESMQIPNVVVKHGDRNELCHVVARMPAQPFECAGIGTGFMLIRREVLERLTEIADDEGGMPVFRFGFRERTGGTMAEDGEDYDFCKRVTKAGWKIIADPRVSTIHIKETALLEYNWQDWEAGWSEPDGPDDAPGVARLQAKVDALKGQVAPMVDFAFARNGCLILDHNRQLEADQKAWHERQAAKGKKAA